MENSSWFHDVSQYVYLLFVAEFIIALADENATFEGFKTALEKNGAEFTVRDAFECIFLWKKVVEGTKN